MANKKTAKKKRLKEQERQGLTDCICLHCKWSEKGYHACGIKGIMFRGQCNKYIPTQKKGGE